MRFAHVDGERREAESGLAGTCPGCGGIVVAHCGEIKVWHWQHKSSRHCDHWWENETQWHRDWKNQFSEDWQEIVQHAEDGERHIADVKTADGWVLEFQHSFLKPAERQSRNAFYSPKLVWVVNALRRPTDLTHFDNMMKGASRLGPTGCYWVASPGSCRLVKEWLGSAAQVFFDFGPKLGLWWMLARLSNDQVMFARYTQTELIEAHGGMEARKDTDFDALVKQLGALVEDYEGLVQDRSRRRSQPPIPGPRSPATRRPRRW